MFFPPIIAIDVYLIGQDNFFFGKPILSPICGFFEHFLALFDTFTARYIDSDIKFEPVVGQQTSRNIKAVISLFETSIEGRQNLFILACECRFYGKNLNGLDFNGQMRYKTKR